MSRGESAPVSRRQVVHVITSVERIGGAERLLVDLAQEPEAKRLWDLSVITVGRKGKMHSDLPATLKVFHFQIDRRRDVPRAALAVTHRLRRLAPDIVHGHLFYPNTLLGVSRLLLTGTTLVQTQHNEAAFLSPRFCGAKAKVARWATRAFDHTIAISEGVRRDLLHDPSLEASRVSVVRNGVNQKRLQSATRAAGALHLRTLGIPQAWPVIVSCGSLVAAKGHETLIAALPLVQRRFPEARLILAGEGPERAFLTALASRVGVEPHVSFLGFHEQSELLMAAADIYAQPSTSEGLGMAVIEAMVVGAPVVVSAISGLNEVVADGVNGLTAEAGNGAAFAAQMIRLLEQPALAQTLVAAAKHAAHDQFDTARVVRELESVYDLATRQRIMTVARRAP